MSDLITVTGPQVRITATGFQPLYEALDVSAYDELCLLTGVMSFESPSSPSISVGLWTGMQLASDAGWYPVFQETFSSVSYFMTLVSDFWAVPNGVLRYVRYNVTVLSGASAATFFISGVARSFRKAT